MKRDVDLCRQLLMDIENQGPNCLLTTLRCGEAPGANERIHHHLRLLIDAGFVKETERTSSGVPCVRLTNSGQELIELMRNENRWREAKWIVQQQTGGLSLTVLMSLLTKWAVDGIARYERESLAEDEFRPARSHPDDRKRFDFHNPLIDRERCAPCEIEMADEPTSVTLPVSLI